MDMNLVVRSLAVLVGLGVVIAGRDGVKIPWCLLLVPLLIWPDVFEAGAMNLGIGPWILRHYDRD